jgi:hypothetical protein
MRQPNVAFASAGFSLNLYPDSGQISQFLDSRLGSKNEEQYGSDASNGQEMQSSIFTAIMFHILESNVGCLRVLRKEARTP